MIYISGSISEFLLFQAEKNKLTNLGLKLLKLKSGISLLSDLSGEILVIEHNIYYPASLFKNLF